ncbi:MAG: D-tyrosyl-tRNA(Tyr) deacylase [Planctomycetes bacterium]|mgnify:CR=1 FL=1|nr:D-tyrosyl-tRNA(Tyr) deacylase [Planctomycetota bacterium]
MITTVQRVERARVLVDGETVGEVARGLLLFVGVERGDAAEDADETARKVLSMRVFAKDKPTDLSVQDISGGCLVVSQFTLAAELQRGHRPDFTAAAHPDLARPLYERVAAKLRSAGVAVATGVFGASMQVELINDGPMTYLLCVRGGKTRARADYTA